MWSDEGNRHTPSYVFILCSSVFCRLEDTLYIQKILISIYYQFCSHSHVDFEKEVNELSISLKNERQSRKSSESKVSSLEDELAEMRSSNTSLEKVCTFSIALFSEKVERVRQSR